jgi:cyclophilin family peptidyl-prolyl cis-trans isomerase
MNMLAGLIVFCSVLVPTKFWFAPGQPIEIRVVPTAPVVLVMTDFQGRVVEPRAAVGEISSEQQIDLRAVWKESLLPGTYVLLAVPPGKDRSEFVGTPLVVQVREDARRDAPPGEMVVRVEPLRFAQIDTDKGVMTVAFYYDVAPNTVDNFLSLASEGFYDGLTFHRIVPGFVIQGGDPRGDGTGGPGFLIDAEFNDRQHLEGVLSMARQGDPIERQGAMPRSDAANSASSQFFICLDYEKTKQLDKRYTVFGRVAEGLDVVREIAKTPVGGENGDTPSEKRLIKSVRVLPVSSQNNPYRSMMFDPVALPQDRR